MNLHEREDAVSLVKAALEVGKGVAVFSKGDVAGHEFHGNQFTTVVGPLKDEESAKQTAKDLGSERHSVYSKEIKDAEGYGTGKHEYFVERDNTIPAKQIFGMSSFAEISARQQKKIAKGDVAGHEFHGNQWSVTSTDRNYKETTKTFKQGKLDSPDKAERAARAHAKNLEANPDIRSVRVHH